jgi:hypothetical protein
MLKPIIKGGLYDIIGNHSISFRKGLSYKTASLFDQNRMAAPFPLGQIAYENLDFSSKKVICSDLKASA